MIIRPRENNKFETCLQEAIDTLIKNNVAPYDNRKYDYKVVIATACYMRFLRRSENIVRKGRWVYYKYKGKLVFLKIILEIYKYKDPEEEQKV